MKRRKKKKKKKKKKKEEKKRKLLKVTESVYLFSIMDTAFKSNVKKLKIII